MRDPRYDLLFEPVRIGPVRTKNRFYQVPHCNGMGHAYPQTLALMPGIKAEGGWGVVATEEVEISPLSEIAPHHAIFSILIVLVFHSVIFADSDPLKKIDHSLIDKFGRQTVAEYIILMKERNVFEGKLPFKTKQEKAHYVYLSLVQKAKSTQAPILHLLKQSKIQYQSFYVTNAIKVTSSYEFMISLASRQDGDRIIDNAPIKMLDYTIDRANGTARGAQPEWGLKMIKADSVWQIGIRGEGVIIAGQDTGYVWELSPLKKKYNGYKDSLNTEHSYNWHDAIHKNNPRFPDTLLNPCGYSTKKPCDAAVLPLDAWIEHSVGESAIDDDGPRVLSTAEEWWLWREATSQATQDAGLIGAPTLTDSLRRADRLATDYGIDVGRWLAAGGPETRLLHEAQHFMRRACLELGADTALRRARLAPAIGAAGAVHFAGFQGPTSQRAHRLFAARRVAGLPGEWLPIGARATSPPIVELAAAEDDETAALAQWCPPRGPSRVPATLMLLSYPGGSASARSAVTSRPSSPMTR